MSDEMPFNLKQQKPIGYIIIKNRETVVEMDISEKEIIRKMSQLCDSEDALFEVFYLAFDPRTKEPTGEQRIRFMEFSLIGDEPANCENIKEIMAHE